MNPQIPTMLRLKNALLKLLPIRPEMEFGRRGGIELRLSRLAKKVSNPEVISFGGNLCCVLLGLSGLFLSGLILGSFHNAIFRIGFVICGMILPLVAVTRSRDQAILLALLWIFAASVLAFFPWPGRAAALLAIPTSLWLLAKLADHTWQADSRARRLYMLAHVGWLMVVLFQCGEGEWMLIFAAGAIGLFLVRCRPGLAALVASGTLITALNLLHGQSRLNLESLVPLVREPPCGVPRSWLMIIDAGWFGHANGPALGRAAAPEVADHWGWVGLIGIALLIALLTASTRCAAKWLVVPSFHFGFGGWCDLSLLGLTWWLWQRSVALDARRSSR